jgi:O-acetyl-ADP-ribose deacetylase (regulator of RNase III)
MKSNTSFMPSARYGAAAAGEPRLLQAPGKALALAAKMDLPVSFPSISTRVYGYPVDKTAVIAIKEVVTFSINQRL